MLTVTHENEGGSGVPTGTRETSAQGAWPGRRRWQVAVAALAATGILAGAWYYWYGGESTKPTLVTAAVTRGDVVEQVDATGKLQAVTTVQVGTQVSGTIKTLGADFNTPVRQGQVIATLDSSLFAAQVEQARATVSRLEADSQGARVQLDDAKVKLRRAQDLSARQLLSASDLEAAEVNTHQAEAALLSADAQIVQAKASLRQAQVNLAHTIIASPIDGVVISRNVDIGQTVAASMQAPTLYVLAKDLGEMQVNAAVSEADIGRIQAGQMARFRVDAYPDRTFSGIVSQVRLEPVVEQNVVSYVTVIAVANADLALKPGMTANVTVEIARADAVLRVPLTALRVRPSAEVLAIYGASATTGDTSTRPRTEPVSGSAPTSHGGPGTPDGSATLRRPRGRVWVLADARLQPVVVDVGISDGQNVAILGGGLEEGATVVTSVAGTSASSAAQTGRSPLLPAGRRGGGSGGGGRVPR